MSKNKILLVSFLLIFFVLSLVLVSKDVSAAITSNITISSPTNYTIQNGYATVDVSFVVNLTGTATHANCSLWAVGIDDVSNYVYLSANKSVLNNTATTLATGSLVNYNGNSTKLWVQCNATSTNDWNTTKLWYRVNQKPTVVVTDNDKGRSILRIGGKIIFTGTVTDTESNRTYDPFTVYVCRENKFAIASGCGGKGQYCKSTTNSTSSTHTCTFTSTSSYSGGNHNVYTFVADSNNYVSEPAHTTFRVAGVTPTVEDMILEYCTVYGYPLPRMNLGQLKQELVGYGYMGPAEPESGLKARVEAVCAGAILVPEEKPTPIWLYVLIGVVVIGVLWFIIKKKKKS